MPPSVTDTTRSSPYRITTASRTARRNAKWSRSARSRASASFPGARSPAAFSHAPDELEATVRGETDEYLHRRMETYAVNGSREVNERDEKARTR